MQKTALIIIDVQRDYFPGGNMELKNPEEAVDQIQRLLTHFRANNLPIFHIQHTMPEWRGVPFLRKGTPGHELHAKVIPLEGEVLIEKSYPNSFHDTALHDKLQEAGVSDIVICGMMTHMCVNATARRAFELAYPMTIISDACATRDLEIEGKIIAADSVHAANLAALNGMIASIVNTDGFLAESHVTAKV